MLFKSNPLPDGLFQSQENQSALITSFITEGEPIHDLWIHSLGNHIPGSNINSGSFCKQKPSLDNSNETSNHSPMASTLSVSRAAPKVIPR